MAEHYRNHPPYMPIIKWQDWERRALVNIRDDARQHLRPCIEVRDSDQHSKLLSELPAVWPNPVLVDYANPTGDLTASRCLELVEFLRHPAGANPAVIPVLNPLDPAGHAGVAAIRWIFRRHQVAYRWRTALGAAMVGGLPAILAAVDAYPATVGGAIVILDLGVTPPAWTAGDLQALVATLRSFAAHGFTAVYLASGAFPDSLAAVQAVDRFPRRDWMLWKSVGALAPELIVGFGDYGTLSPLWKESILKQGGGRTRSNIRYTMDDEWLILRGGANSRQECIALSELMTTIYRREFQGRGFSYGDELIADRANATLPSKDRHCGHYRITEAWNHHMTYVVRTQY
jgi:hypothetical protein